MDTVLPLKRDVVLFVALLIVAVVIITVYLTGLDNTIRQYTTPTASNDSIATAFNRGVVVSMVQLMQATDNCQVTSIKYFNTTRRLVDIDCVRALLQQQNITLKGD